MKAKDAQKNEEKRSKTNLVINSFKAVLKLVMLILLISSAIFGGKILIENETIIKNGIAARNLAMTYDEVQENDNSTQNEYVKFDAYFLQ